MQPIIHNLSPDSTGYVEVKAYNSLINERPVATGNLAQKIEILSAWKTRCRKALVAAEKAVGVRAVPGNNIVGFLTLDARA